MKTCSKCKVIKPITEFYVGKDGIHCRCKACDKKKAKAWKSANYARASATTKAWIKRNPDFRKSKKLNKKLNKKYGITPEQFDALSAAQDGCCAICKKQFLTDGQVDHCHATGNIRGLLCIPCNLGIGHLKESREIMERAIIYLALN